MLVSKEYEEEQDEVVTRNFKARYAIMNYLRFKVAKKFMEGQKKTLCIGSGGFEPKYMNATHACDVVPLSGELLKTLHWNGEFKVCSCDDLPYKDKEFDVAICQDVIEHLPSLNTVAQTFKEINRVAWHWLVTTPCASAMGKRDKWNIEPTHKLFLTESLLEYLASPIDVYIRTGVSCGVPHAFVTNREK